jgi:hypothetical protein
MSRYRILEKPRCDYSGELSVEYYPQYKLWGLFWVGLDNDCGYVSSYYESNARETIKAHKARKVAKHRKVRIIEVANDD